MSAVSVVVVRVGRLLGSISNGRVKLEPGAIT